MSQNIRFQFWILAAAALIFLTYLGAASLWDEDETLYASCAREMMQRGDWVVPMFNGQMFPDKPPLMFWLMMAGFELFGQNEFGARFFSAVLGMGTALLTYHLGRLLFNPKVGLWAGLIVASSIIFTVSARAATVDSALVFVTTSAMLCFVAGFRGQRSEVRGQGVVCQPPASGLPPPASSGPQFAICNLQFPICNKSIIRFGLFLLLYACLGMAVLAKGPVGFLLPMASIGLFLMIVNSRTGATAGLPTGATAGLPTGATAGLPTGATAGLPTGATAGLPSSVIGVAPGLPSSVKDGIEQTKRGVLWKWLTAMSVFHPMNFLKSLWQLRPITGAVLLLAVTLPWFILVGQRTDGLWLEQFFAKFNLRPFVEPILGHSGPVWYYIPAVLIGFFPWSVFLGPAAVDTLRRIRQRDPRRDAYVLLTCWFGMFFVFWSICSTKLPHYVLPAYPALALLTGCFLETWITQPARVGPSWMKNAWITTMVVGLGIIVAVGVVARIYLPGEEFIGLVGLILVAGGGLCLYYGKRRHHQRAAVVFACTAVIFLTAMFGFAAQRVDRHQNAKRLLAQIRGDSLEPTPVCAYRFFRQSMVYYAGHPVGYCDSPEELQQFLEQTPHVYLITLDKYAAEVERKHPGQFRVLSRERRFLANDDMVVLAPTDSSQTAARPPINRE